MSEQDGTQATKLQHPTIDDQETWREYWKQQGQTWRTQPEIDAERQKYLTARGSIALNLEKGISPFADIKLSRADVEWLLATHENGHGPIDWSDESQRERKGLDLRGADLRGVDLSYLPLASLVGNISSYFVTFPELHEKVAIHLEAAKLFAAHLEGAKLFAAHLEGADLSSAHLEGAFLKDADLKGANLFFAHFEGADLSGVHLEGAKLNGSFFSSATKLNGVILSGEQYGVASLVDVHWGEANVAVVDWSALSILGDEPVAKREKDRAAYKVAVRAYRQLSIVLRNQGLNEDAARFAYRAQLMQRKVFRDQKFGQYLFSLFLDLLAGYGYKPRRSFLAYLLVITAFATAYFIIGHTVGPVLSPLGSVVFSMTSFHGRGFFPGGIRLDDPLTVLAALEAFVGLLIEVTFIATLTQRLFGK